MVFKSRHHLGRREMIQVEHSRKQRDTHCGEELVTGDALQPAPPGNQPALLPCYVRSDLLTAKWQELQEHRFIQEKMGPDLTAQEFSRRDGFVLEKTLKDTRAPAGTPDAGVPLHQQGVIIMCCGRTKGGVSLRFSWA